MQGITPVSPTSPPTSPRTSAPVLGSSPAPSAQLVAGPPLVSPASVSLDPAQAALQRVAGARPGDPSAAD